MNAVKDFWFEALSVEAVIVLKREWPYWSGVHPASPIDHIYHQNVIFRTKCTCIKLHGAIRQKIPTIFRSMHDNVDNLETSNTKFDQAKFGPNKKWWYNFFCTKDKDALVDRRPCLLELGESKRCILVAKKVARMYLFGTIYIEKRSPRHEVPGTMGSGAYQM